MTPLSAHFSLEEATASQTAARLGIDNTPTQDVLEHMRHAAQGMERVRAHLNHNAIIVSSWLRTLEVNRAIGSKDNSAHITGFAVDFTCPTFGTPDAIVRRLIDSKIQFQQIIREYDSWVHISFNGSARQALIIDKQGARPFV